MSECEFFFDKSKITDPWSQVGISLVVRSKGVEIKESDLSFTFRSGANELFLSSSRSGVDNDPVNVSIQDGSESKSKNLGIDRL